MPFRSILFSRFGVEFHGIFCVFFDKIITSDIRYGAVMPTEFLLAFAVSFLAGAAGALGIGGGAVLLLYLTLFASLPQLQAQGINLLFFIPIAFTAIVIHFKNGLIDRRAVLFAVPFGLAGAFLGLKLAEFIGNDLLRRIFGILLGVVGLWELFKKQKNKKSR